MQTHECGYWWPRPEFLHQSPAASTCARDHPTFGGKVQNSHDNNFGQATDEVEPMSCAAGPLRGKKSQLQALEIRSKDLPPRLAGPLRSCGSSLRSNESRIRRVEGRRKALSRIPRSSIAGQSRSSSPIIPARSPCRSPSKYRI